MKFCGVSFPELQINNLIRFSNLFYFWSDFQIYLFLIRFSNSFIFWSDFQIYSFLIRFSNESVNPSRFFVCHVTLLSPSSINTARFSYSPSVIIVNFTWQHHLKQNLKNNGYSGISRLFCRGKMIFCKSIK